MWPLTVSQPSADSGTVGSVLVTESFLQQPLVSYDDRLRYPGDNDRCQENDPKRIQEQATPGVDQYKT